MKLLRISLHRKCLNRLCRKNIVYTDKNCFTVKSSPDRSEKKVVKKEIFLVFVKRPEEALAKT
jgi:hypothetical protein